MISRLPLRTRLSVLAIACAATLQHGKSAPIQLLDAAQSASITASGGVVAAWRDQSGTGHDAIAGAGIVRYPGATTLRSGLPSVDFSSSGNYLTLFGAGGQPWLDQSGGNPRGFAVLVAFRVGALRDDWSDLIGNSSDVGRGFALRFGSDGAIQGYLGGVTIQKTTGQLIAGDTVVYGANYYPADGRFEFWDSKNYASQVATVAAADFRQPNPVGLGRTEFDVRVFNGLVGEVQIYDTALSAADFRQIRETLAAKWAALPVTITPNWRVIPAGNFARDDIFVAGWRIDDPGSVLPASPATQDCTPAFAQLIRSAQAAGGGVIYIPAGQYRLDGTLILPPSVFLRGDWQPPTGHDPIRGTILAAYAGRGTETGLPFIGLSESSGVHDLAIWYPAQDPSNIQPYPPALQSQSGGNHNVQNVTLVNPYTGITTFMVVPTGIGRCPMIRNVYGTPLKLGIELDRLADIGRIETVNFSPAFWQNSGLPGAPLNGEHAPWIAANGTGLLLRRIDWSYSCYVTLAGYNIGLALRQSRLAGDSTYPNGQCYAFTLDGCRTGVAIDNTHYAGMQLTRFNIRGATTGIAAAATSSSIALFHSCSIQATGAALQNDGDEKFLFQNCVFSQGVLRAQGGHLVALNSAFSSAASNHIELGANARGSILGNWFDGAPRISNQSQRVVVIDPAPIASDDLPAYDFGKPAAPFTPANATLFVVTAPAFGAVGDGVADDSAAFQSALATARVNGGGIVFVPAGTYRLTVPLVVPGGVELRGIHDLAHSPAGLGSVLLVYPGRNDENGTPFIQLEAKAGLRGLTFHYPAQIYDPANAASYGLAPYPYLIRGLGSDIYVIDVAATLPWQLLDLASVRCDRHYVDYVWATAVKNGIRLGAGSDGGQVQNCQLNLSSFTQNGAAYPSIPNVSFDGLTSLLFSQARPYVLGAVTREVLHENFAFGGLTGLTLAAESGTGPSGYCLGFGIDQNRTALLVDAIGPGGLTPINTQLVSVDATAGRYIECSAGFQQRFTLATLSAWGGAQTGVLVRSGVLALQLAHLHRVTSLAYDVRGSGRVVSINGNLTQNTATFLACEPTASALFAGHLINAAATAMPRTSAPTIVAMGNLTRATDLPIALAPPAGLATVAGDGAASLQWKASTAANFNDYRVYRSTGNGYGLLATRISANTFTDYAATPGVACTYAVSALDASGNESPLSPPATTVARTVATATRLTNLSARAQAGTGSKTLIVGLAMIGGSDKRILLRATGPGLGPFGLTATLPHPRLALFRNDGTPQASNAGWSDRIDAGETAAVTALAGAFALPPGSSDAAFVPTLAAGNYTAQVSDNSGATGVCLAEIYDATFNANSSRLVDFSARAQVGVGNDVLIAGFVVTGPTAKQFLVRAAGPALAGYGVTGTLADPQLTLVAADSAVAIASNDNWSAAPNAIDVAATAARVGAFPFVPGSRDAALLVTLPPGGYSAVVSGVGGTTGVALVEIYDVP